MFNVIPRFVWILLAIVVAIRLAWRALVAHSRATETSLNESARMSQRPTRKHAATCVVAGAGVAGTLTAAVAALHFERVILVDPVASDGDAHAHIAQLDQAHTIGPMVLNCLRTLWSRETLNEALQREGGRTYSQYDCPPELNLMTGTVSMSDTAVPPTDDALASMSWLCLSRRAAQRMLRTLLQNSTPGVEVLQGKITAATYADEAKTRITAVQVTTATKTTTLPCELLIDCSGLAKVYRSLIPSAANTIKQDKYRMQVQYSTAYVDVHPSLVERMPMTDEGRRRGVPYDRAGMLTVMVPALSPIQEFFMICRFERNALGMVNISYVDKPQSEMPSTLDSYAAAYNDAHNVLLGRNAPTWFDELIEVLRENEQVRGEKSKFIKLRDNESWCLDLRSDSEAARLPSNMLLVGDTYCKLNPAFGQGTQKAASEVMILHSVLLDHQPAATDEKKAGLADTVTLTHAVRAFNKQRHSVTFQLFDGHRAMDFSQPTVVQNNPDVAPNVGQEIRFLTRGLWKWLGNKQDSAMTDTFAKIILAGAMPPAMLLHPKNLYRILYGALWL